MATANLNNDHSHPVGQLDNVIDPTVLKDS